MVKPPQCWDHKPYLAFYPWDVVIKLRFPHLQGKHFLKETIESSHGEGNEVGECFIRDWNFFLVSHSKSFSNSSSLEPSDDELTPPSK